MEEIVVFMRDVVPGDEVHMGTIGSGWERVTKVTNNGELVSIYFGVSVHKKFDTRSQTAGHPLQAIRIRRKKL